MLKFDANGLIPAIVQDVNTRQVLMLGYMNAEALRRTVTSGQAWFWSRSRGALWHKGETSGNYLNVRAVRVDCDGEGGHQVRRAERSTCGRVQIGSGLLSISSRTHSSRSRSGIARA